MLQREGRIVASSSSGGDRVDVTSQVHVQYCGYEGACKHFSSAHMGISRRLYTSSRASPRRSHAHYYSEASSFVRRGVSRRLAWPLERLYLDSCSLYHSTPRSITPGPDSIPSPHRPIAAPRPRRPKSTLLPSPCELHVAAIATNFGSEPLLHLLYLHYTCSQLATYSHTHKHACVYPGMPHLPYQELLTPEQRKQTSPSLPRRPVLPLPERIVSTRHAYLHASMQNKTRAASRAFLCQCAHRPRVPIIIIIVATRCHHGPAAIVVQPSCDFVRRSPELKQRKQETHTPCHALPCPRSTATLQRYTDIPAITIGGASVPPVSTPKNKEKKLARLDQTACQL